MGNLGGAEILVILVVALIVLGPTRLPQAARQLGDAFGQIRRLSSGFQQEMKAAMDEVEATIDPPAESSRPADDKGRRLVTADSAATDPAPTGDSQDDDTATEPASGDQQSHDDDSADPDPDDQLG